MKPRLLYLCDHAPWPCNDGTLIRNYWLIRALSRRYTIDLVTADEPELPMPQAFRELIGEYACFPRSQRLRSGFGRAVQAVLPNESSLTAGWTSGALREFVAERLGRYPYAAIQADLPMHNALPHRNAIPIIYNAHNCEYGLLSRRAKSERPHVGLALAVDSLRVKRIEAALVARAALVVACSEADVHDFERFCPSIRSKAVVVPNGVDVEHYGGLANVASEEQAILITGSMDWRADILGLRWFLRGVLPELQQLVPGVRVRVAGRLHAILEKELADCRGVEAVPNPKSMEQDLARATIVAAPIVASSSSRFGILEAWASSRPVVSTRAGAARLRYEDGVDLLVRDDPMRFAYEISGLLADSRLRSSLVANARRRVIQYDWRTIGAELLAAYDSALPPSRRSIPTVSEETIVASRG